MESDRELLILAAKAAGYEYRPQNGAIVVDGIPSNWNPLTDDGDALRLAIERSIDLRFDDIEKVVEARHPLTSYGAHEEYGDDKKAATRRAIVRAAALMGGDK
jgi:hypothetical protein